MVTGISFTKCAYVGSERNTLLGMHQMTFWKPKLCRCWRPLCARSLLHRYWSIVALLGLPTLKWTSSPFLWHMFDIILAVTFLPLDITIWYLMEYLFVVTLISPATYGLTLRAEFLADRATKGLQTLSISKCICTFFG